MNTEFDLRLQRVRLAQPDEFHSSVVEEVVAENVANGVVLQMEDESAAERKARIGDPLDLVEARGQLGDIRRVEAVDHSRLFRHFGA